MRVLATGLSLFLAAFLAHVALWRVYPPERQIRALLRVFFGVFAAGAAALSAGVAGATPLPFPELLHAAVLFTALTLAYIQTATTLEVDSPSLSIVLAIDAAGAAGLAREQLRATLTDELLVRPRLDDLVRDQVVAFDGTTYRLLRRGGFFIGFIVAWRRLMRQPVRGG
jgi:hypothetical protein